MTKVNWWAGMAEPALDAIQGRCQTRVIIGGRPDMPTAYRQAYDRLARTNAISLVIVLSPLPSNQERTCFQADAWSRDHGGSVGRRLPWRWPRRP